MSTPRSILLGRALTGLSLVVFVTSAAFMAFRVAEYYRLNPPPRHIFERITDRHFKLWDRPVAITDAATPEGASALRIAYGERELLLPVHPPKATVEKELGAYDDWVAVAAFAPLKEGRVALDMTKPGNDVRVVIINRHAAPGHDDDMGGLVGRKKWTFEMVELLPSGDITRRTLQFPAYKYTTGEKYLPIHQTDPTAAVEPIEERSWEFQAALLTIPKLHISNYRYRTTGVNAMGWTLPGTGLGMMGVIGGIVLWHSRREPGRLPRTS